MSCDGDTNNIKIDENSNSEKVNNRTHHTRFFEKLYGNLETNNCEKDFQSKENNNDLEYPFKLCANKIPINSPSESSAGSSSSEIINVTRLTPNFGNSLPAASIIPSHFTTTLRFGAFSTDQHNHFAAFLARRRKQQNKQRRQRTTFSSDQTLRLEVEFNKNEYISRSRRYELAESLQLSETQIKIWYQNRRAKEKRIEKAQIDQQYRNFAASSIFYSQQCSFFTPTNNLSTFQ